MRNNFIILLLVFSFNLVLGQTISLPYTNYFDNLTIDTVNWTHYASSGVDDWEIGIPNNPNALSNALSPPNVWGTDLDNSFQGYSNRSLETPYFNLTDVSQHYIFSIHHKVYAGSSGNEFKIEYKVGANGTWLLLNDPSMSKKNWQSTSTFSNFFTSYRNSAIDLFFIQGQDSVKFRFRLNSQIANGNGWLIDNFTILPEYYNVVAPQGDTIEGVNSHFTNITVSTDFIFSNQWSVNYNFTDEFYFSHDNVLDAGDQLLGVVNHYEIVTDNNYTNTFPLPAGLSAGEYYIFYVFDVNNVLAENDESDNSNFAILILDSIYTTDYIDDFDSTINVWNSNYGEAGSQWKRGDPNGWHVENPRSGENAWVSGLYVNNQNYLESPYLDLTASTNTTICWWYKNSKAYGSPYFYLQLPIAGNTTISTPVFPSLSQTAFNKLIPSTRFYGWDCHCEDISNYDGEISTKFRFLASGNISPNSLDQTLIDDVYIGASKADVAIGGERDNRFTSSSTSTDTLTYYLFNAGLDQLPTSTSTFYWSNDSIYDATDILLGSQAEPVIDDTSFVVREFTFTKPTLTEGEFFIIYVLDDGDLINEMREYDNVGYFRINQTSQQTLPYENDFETGIMGWRHSSTLGIDNWTWDVPAGTILDTAFSGTKAFFTNVSDSADWKSRMHLYTPVFDLTELQHPVMEFDLLTWFYGYGYQSWPNNMGNIMYSIDGGNSWHLLTSESDSYKLWYSFLEFESISGEETLTEFYNPAGEILYMKYAPHFKNTFSYQGRDYDDNTHYVADLEHIKNEKQVQFMMVYSNHNAPVEGMLLDNFEIKEASIDLRVPSTKKLMVASTDVQLKTFFHIKNDENYISDSTSVRIYVSIDSLLDASDILLQTNPIPEIKPYEKHLINLVLNTPVNYGQFNYLIYEIDPNNLSNETNELNNVSFLNLTMDTAANYNYPILFDFDEMDVDGWTWWHDSTGYYHGHRFRNQTVINDYLNQPEDGVWFLDAIDLLGFSSSYSGYPVHHLEPPAFDFSDLSVIEMTFDYRSVGTMSMGGNSQGGNLSYSIDGGQSWIVLDYTQDPYAENWYQLTAIQSLGGEPGWGYEQNWTTAKYNLSFLGGQQNVRFRFNWRAEYRPSAQHLHGFRLDNFKMDGEFNDLIASDIHPIITLNSVVQPSFQLDYQIENNGLGDILFSETAFYWSNDTILDSGDALLYIVPESIFDANTLFSGSQTIYFPTPIIDTTYYVLYFTDSDSTVNEPNESNNLGWWRVDFTDSNYIDLISTPLIYPINTDIFSDYFYFEFEYKNDGTLPSTSSLVSVHWSLDTLFDAGDLLLYDIEEPGLLPSDYITHSGNVYFPHPINDTLYHLLVRTDVNNENVESDENNNFFWVQVIIDTTGLGLDEVGMNDGFRFVPGQEFLELTYFGDNLGEAFVTIRNMNGQIILKKKELLLSNDELLIRRPYMEAGKYFLTIQKDNKYYVFNFIHYANN